MSGLLTQQITILRRTTTAVEGIDGTAGPFVDEETVAASVQPAKREENTADRDTSIADVNVFILPGPVIDAHDRFRHDGVVYEVIGPPGVWHSLAGPDHQQLAGRRVEG